MPPFRHESEHRRVLVWRDPNRVSGLLPNVRSNPNSSGKLPSDSLGEGMTLTPQRRAELYRKFDSVLGERMERIFTQAMLGDVTWDRDDWSGLLDWLEGPLRKRMYSGWMAENPDRHIEEAPMYMAYEGFDRARMQGQLDDSPLVRVLFSAVKEMHVLMSDGLKAFKVEFKEPESGA